MQSSDSKLLVAAEQYLKIVGAKISTTSVRKSLLENPYYPSLYSLSSVCTRHGMPNQAFSVPRENFSELEAPFLAYYNDSENDFVVVSQIAEDSVQLVTDGNKKIRIAKDQFLRSYREIIFVAEPTENSGESDYATNVELEKKTVKKNRILLIASAFSVLLLFATSLYSSGSHLANLLLLAVAKMLGLGATVLLLTYEIDKSNEIVKSICSAGKQNGCDAILNSKASKIFGISWGEIGFYYFSSTILFLWYPGIAPSIKLSWLMIGAAIASPYIIFSLYYQWVKIKNWCPLCLTVQVALFLEVVWAVFNFLTTSPSMASEWSSPLSLVLVALCISLPILVWNVLKPIISTSKKAPEYEAAFKRLLYNPDTFDALLQQQESAADGWQNLGITLGNPDAPNTILKVCNPFCGPCAKAHPALEEVISHSKNYNMRIIFTATNTEGDPKTAVVKHLLAVAEKGDANQTIKAVDDWYRAEKKDYTAFAAKYPMNGELKRQGDKIEAMNNWCKEAMISFTPTIFINGKRLPENYSAQELKHILQ